MDWGELEKKQKDIWEAIDYRFSELVKKYGSVVYCKKKDLKKPVYDGCLNVRKYAEARIHVMWILKEHNDQPASLDNGHLAVFADCLGEVDDADVIRFKGNVSSFRSLRLIERASRVLLNLPEGDSTEAFKSVAIVELGKCSGENQTPNSRLDDLVKWWGDILKRQVVAYQPDVIIVPGCHFNWIKELLEWNNNKGVSRKAGKAKAELYYTTKNLPIITIPHPSWYQGGCTEDDWMKALLRAFKKAMPHVQLGRT